MVHCRTQSKSTVIWWKREYFEARGNRVLKIKLLARFSRVRGSEVFIPVAGEEGVQMSQTQGAESLPNRAIRLPFRVFLVPDVE